MKPETVLDLANIRQALVRMEDTIVFNFIERSQFYQTDMIYQIDKLPIPNFHGSFLQWTLLQQERTHSQLRRYELPDETPFFPKDLLPSLLPPINYPPILASYSDEINENQEIMSYYIREIVPLISAGTGEQPENLGSACVADIECLQSLSRRIHFGKFVAELKFRQETEKFTELILKKDVPGIEAAITNSAVEEKILLRLVEKGKAYGIDPSLKYSQAPQSKVAPEVIAKIYKDWIIPLTKKVEVDYLLRRLELE